jgi:hypothetical protein
MKTTMLALLAGIAFTAPAMAKPDLDTIVGVNGACSALTLAGRDTGCTSSKGLLYMHFAHGVVTLSVGADDGRMIAFVSEKDAQPSPGKYWLYLTRVRTFSKINNSVFPVAGVCKVDMADDGMHWYSVTCAAEDENQTTYSLKFRPSNEHISVSHPR